MRPLRLASLSLAFAFVIVPQLLHAQRPRPGIVEVSRSEGRGGFWASLALGVGGEQVNLSGDGLGYSDVIARPVVDLALGGTIGQRLRLGGEYFALVNDSYNAVETISHIGVVAQYYPIRRSGLFLKGGVGLARSGVDYDFGGSVADYGVSGTVGLGWEARIARHFYVVPEVNALIQSYSPSGPGYVERMGGLSIGFMYQHGR
jgi:hypothetical protein